MMRSVSMSLPRSGSAVPADLRRIVLNGHAAHHAPDVDDFAGDRRGGDHRRAHQQRAAGRAALPALEIAVRRGRADLAALEASGFIARHIEQPAPRHSKPASRNTRRGLRARPPARTPCDPGTTSALHVRRDVMAADDARGLAQIGQARVGARADERDVDPRARDRLAAVEAHELERLVDRRARSPASTSAGRGSRSSTHTDWPGIDPPRHRRLDRRRVDRHLVVVARVGIRRHAAATTSTRRVERVALRRERPALAGSRTSSRRD